MDLVPASATALVLGVGCRRGCTYEALAALVDQVLREHELGHLRVAAIASLDRKADEPALQALARQRQCRLEVFSAVQLLAYTDQLSQCSAAVFQATGCYGVAEGAALAMAQRLGVAQPRLQVTRRASAAATVAICLAAP